MQDSWKFTKLLCLTAAIAFTAYSGFAQAASPGDGLCKTDPVPPGYVPIGELNNAGCANGSNPFAMNAWQFDKARDGITTCQSPDYLEGFPPSISYPIVRSVVSPSCSPKLDGGPNAFVLGTPESVKSMKITKMFRDSKTVPFCFDNSTEQSKILATFLYEGFVEGGKPLTLYIVKRVFYADVCPAPQGGARLNAVVVQKFGSGLDLLDKVVFACALSLADAASVKLDHYWGPRITEFHDDKCGTETGLNAVKVRYATSKEAGR